MLFNLFTQQLFVYLAVAFHVETSGGITEIGVIRYQRVLTNEGSGLQRNSEFVAPLSGVYYFLTDSLDIFRRSGQFSIRKNGEIVSRSRIIKHWNSIQSVVLFLQKGDRVDSFYDRHTTWEKSRKDMKYDDDVSRSIFLGFRMGPN